MKTILLALIGLGLCAPAKSASLSTTDGVTYNNITTERADPDGLYLEYTLPGGGLGMSKVKFSRLSPDQQKHFGFEANKAREYEAQVARANEDYRQESIRFEQAAQARRAIQQASEIQDEKALNDRILAQAQLKAAEADLARAQSAGGNYGGDGGGSYGWGGGLYALPRTGRVSPASRVYAPIVTPIPFPQINTPNSTHFPGFRSGTGQSSGRTSATRSR